MAPVVRPVGHTAVDGVLNQLAPDVGRDGVAPFAEIVRLGRFGVLDERRVDLALRQQRIEGLRRRLDEQYVVAIAPVVPRPTFIKEAGAAIDRADTNQHRFGQRGHARPQRAPHFLVGRHRVLALPVRYFV